MATRLYFSSSVSAPQSVGFGTNWSDTNSAGKYALLTEKNGESLVTGITQDFSVGSRCLDRQFVSPQISNSVFINGQVACQLMCREFNNGDNTVTAFAARVITASGTNRGDLLVATKWFGPGSELINNATMRNMAFTSGTIMTSVTALPNDRLVVEIGFDTNGGATPQGAARYGAPVDVADLPQNMTQTTSGVGWVEFVSNVTFVGGAATVIVPLLMMNRFRMAS